MIALLTDFGAASHYTGQIKAVLRGVEVIDLCHDIPPGDVKAGAYVLLTSWHLFPEKTVFLAVVDPGVGTDRPAIAGSFNGYFFVGPDNGIFSPFIQKGANLVRLPVPPHASNTFHGRDLFAPAAKALAMGARLEDMGQPLESPLVCQWFQPRQTPQGIRARVVLVDRFGNLITDVPGDMLSGRRWAVMAGGKTVLPGKTYGDVEPGQAVALVGSGGFLEISIRDGNASGELGLGVGDVVEVIWKTS